MIADELERLARLKAQGVITEEEFVAQKATLFAGANQKDKGPSTATPNAQLDSKWKKRFAFFDKYGPPFSKRASAGARELGFWERGDIFFNPWAFIFGPIYFLVLGMPKRALSLVAISILIPVIFWDAYLEYTPNWYWIGFGGIYAALANYSYYIKVGHGRDEWNPFKDML